MIKQTAEQKKREQILDKDWVEDLVFVHHNIHSCDEIDYMLTMGEFCWWMSCPICSADILEDGTVRHRMQ